jgi:cell surface protein SprA
LKGTRNFGWKVLAFVSCAALLAHVAARGFRHPFEYEEPDPVDTPANGARKADTLRFPIADHRNEPGTDSRTKGIDLADPANVNRSIEYDPADNRYYLSEKVGDQFIRNPSFMSFDEYQKYSAQQDEQNYWKRRLDALTLFNKKPDLPVMYKEGIFDRIFGGQGISVRPQGNVDVTVGGNWQNIQNPTLVQRAQKYGIFDFDMQMNVNLLAQVGDKLKLNISNNTKATFDYQNVQKLEYTGKEDEIIKKIEAGNVSFPLRSSLIQGVQSLFGLKTQLQFGKLWVTAALSQQKSKRQSITVQGGAQTQTFGIKADDYEENKHFFIGQFFRNNYNTALRNFPIINSQATINKIEVWVTNQTGAIDGVRDVLCFQDLGETSPYRTNFTVPGKQIQPDNRANSLYDQLQQNPEFRRADKATLIAQSFFPASSGGGTGTGSGNGIDFSRTTARKLNPSEFTFNPQLGYISLNTQVNPNDILGVAYRYTYNGKVYQVGEFAEDLPPDTTNQKVMILKLLKTQNSNTAYPLWDLMMKNVYLLGGIGVSKEDFRLNVLYQDPGGGEKRYLPSSAAAGVPLISLLNLDRLNFQNDPQPDGVFDYIEGITVIPQQGRIIFPVLEPFGSDLKPAFKDNRQDENKYLYQILYDSTKTVARQFQQKNRFIMRGSYRSASSSEIFLGGFNIPPGSVTVTAGGQKLIENSDYQIDYGLGRLKIINTGILTSGIPINVAYEDNATFGFQQQNFMGLHLDYYANNKLTVGGTIMRLTERPFTQKTSFGEDPIQNTVIGTDVAYQSELPGLTRLLDKLPIFSTTAPSFINASAEVATLRPGHPKQINSLDPEGAVYIDDFEGTRSAYDLKYPAAAWSLASVPFGARDRFGNILFPEASDNNKLTYGFNRARLAWYLIEPTLIDPVGGVPGYVKSDPNQHYIRLVQQQDVFPAKNLGGGVLNGALSTFDLTFVPNQRGPYNFDVNGTNPDGTLSNPQRRWGGITRPLEYSDFEASNVEYIEFWLLDPFINKTSSPGGTLFLNLGNVSEDVLKDSRKTFENGIPYPKDQSKLDRTAWGNVPQFQQQITRAFDNDPAARAIQDVGYDGLNNEEEAQFFAQYLTDLGNRLGVGTPAYTAAAADPASDDYRYFRDNYYDQGGGFIRNRYLAFNNPQGNSPVADASAAFSSAATTIPESEDIDRDNTLNESEDYYSYRVELTPSTLRVGSNFIVASQTANNVKMPNGTTESETWYQFKIPIREYQEKVGNIADFRSIRFMRMYLTGFTDTVTTRFAQLNLGRNQWRRYMFSLKNPGENIPDDERIGTDFTVTSVSLEENRDRTPIPYVIPPGVSRQLQAVSSGNAIQQNEQALSLQVCALKDGDARAAYKEVNVDMRQFGRLRMFVHGEAFGNQAGLKDGDVAAFIRIGSDFINNYYEYQIPLKITPPNPNRPDQEIWPLENQVDVALQDLVAAKTARNAAGGNPLVPYTVVDAAGHNIVVVGNPNIGESKTIMLGIVNPKKDARTPNDDGMTKCAEVWFNELRMTGLNEKPGYAATAKVNMQLADLGTVNAGGSMHTQGYGNIDQKLQQRQRDNFYQYDANTNLALGKLMPRNWGVQLPLFVGYSESVSNPQYNPYDLDVTYKDQIKSATSAAQRDSMRKAAQDYTSITSVNLNNVRVLGNAEKQNAKTMPWSVKNFDLSYAYNRQFKRNPLIEGDELTNHRLGLGYAYSVRSKPLEPFKSLIKSKSKWLALIKDINLNPLPSTISFRTDMNRIVDETKVRVIGDGVYEIPSTFYKNFTWSRTYALRWELTKSLSLDYAATNNSRIDEPYGRIDSRQKRDTLWDAIKRGGRNTLFGQQANVSYNVPFSKLPATDWVNLRVGYGATYTWTAASRLAYTLGNTIGNTQSKTVNGELNFTQLYNKNRFLRAANAPRNRALRKGAAPNAGLGGDRPDALRPSGPGDKSIPQAGQGSLEPAGGGGNQQTAGSAARKSNERPKTLNLRGVVINTVNMSDQQLDSVRKLIREEELAKARADKKKRKADRKAARKKRRATTPQLSPLARTGAQLLTMVKRATVSYTESGSTVLPGYMDSTVVFGVNPGSGYPGVAYAFGGQPVTSYLDALSAANRISTDSLFNAQFQQTHTSSLNIAMQVEPIPNDLRIDLSLTKQFSKNHSELYKDTSIGRTTGFTHNNPYETGSFNMTTIALKTLFDRGSGATTRVFQDFVRDRTIISRRLGDMNPYTNGAMNPGSDSFSKGYNRYSQDVLIPAFIAAYSGRSGSSVPLMDYENNSIRSNPFRRYMPMPNWRLNYNGLSRIPAFRDVFNTFTLTNSYTGTLSMSSFVSALYYQDIYALGFPSFLDSNSGNYVPYFQVPNVTISEQFAPVIGIDASLKNNMTLRFEYRRSRTASLSLIDYQISETKSAEYVFGGGYRIRGLKLPFSILGFRKLDNDLNIKVDIGIRDDITTNTYLAQDLSIITRGQKVITISPSADYIINDRLTLRFFYDRRRSIPYTTQSYPMSTTRAGLTLRFIFAN